MSREVSESASGRLKNRLGSVNQSPLKKNRKVADLRDKLKNTPSIDRNQVRLLEPKKAPQELEQNPEVLKRRTKDIEYGKNTQDYVTYREEIPKEDRKCGMPTTPNKFAKMGRRRWDGLVKAWKINVHRYVSNDLGTGTSEEKRTMKFEAFDIGDWNREIEEQQENELLGSLSDLEAMDSSGFCTPTTSTFSNSCTTPDNV